MGAARRAPSVEARIRRLCLSLPGVTERLSHGSPAFFAPKQFLQLWPEGHHDDGFAHMWCAAPIGAQDTLVANDSLRFFRPPYVGGRGWIGVRLDVPISDNALAGLIEDAYCAIAPSRLTRIFDAEHGRRSRA